MNTVTIYPEHPNMTTVAKQLLALAKDAKDVEYRSWPQAGFTVPEELFDRWEASLPKDEHGDPVITPDPKPVLTHGNPVSKGDIEAAVAREVAEEAKAQRKPGRPKKIQGGQ